MSAPQGQTISPAICNLLLHFFVAQLFSILFRNQSKKVEDVLSKENKESVPSKPKSAKDQMFDSLVSASRNSENKEDRRKRKQQDEDGGPRIKLKISVNRSPDKSDNTYKVSFLVMCVFSDKSD